MRVLILATCLLLGAGLAQQPPQTPPPAKPAEAPPASTPAPAPALSHGGFVVVLDPAHGGADSGARGSGGIIEKDVTLMLARTVKSQMEAAGIRVILTRSGDEAPSFDDRSAIANAHREAVFVTLHIASTGSPGTARVYFQAPSAGARSAADRNALEWDRAQEPFADASRDLAGILQVQVAQKLRGSPEVPIPSPVRQLRTVAAPAVAVELSSVSVSDRGKLDAALAPLAEAIVKAVSAFRQSYRAEAD